MTKLKNFSLLYLEDDTKLANAMIEIFHSFFKNVYHTTTISGAEEILYEKNPEVLLLDIEVEDGNSLKLIESLLANNISKHVIVTSSYSTQAYLLQSIPLKLVDYLIKPVGYKTFLEVLSKVSKRIHVQVLPNGILYDYTFESLSSLTDVFSYKELILLQLVIKYKHEVITYEKVISDVEFDYGMKKSTMRNHLSNLRRYFGKSFIESIHDVGYKINLPNSHT
ncbi:MAG: response regulator [Sulfurimonas sp.]|nr:response regulator [Sulfurimonas sp.]